VSLAECVGMGFVVRVMVARWFYETETWASNMLHYAQPVTDIHGTQCNSVCIFFLFEGGCKRRYSLAVLPA